MPEKSQDYVDQNPNVESYRTPNVEEEQHSEPLDAPEQMKENVEEGEESIDNSAHEGAGKGLISNENAEGGNAETEKLVDNVESVPALDQNIKQAEKGDTGVLDQEGGEYKDESSNTEQRILQGNMAQRKHSLADSERLRHKTEGRVDGSLRKGQEDESSAEASLARPKNVICTAAGCFSSLEELDMFNELASQVRNSLEELDKIESAVVHEKGKDADTLLKSTEDGNPEPESSEPKSNLR